jgi:hypothetical protein
MDMTEEIEQLRLSCGIKEAEEETEEEVKLPISYGLLPEIQTADDKTIRGFAVIIPNPLKTAILRLPTSIEYLTYLGAQKTIYRPLGRGKGQSEDLPTPAADQKLFRAIRLDRGEEFDDAEALYAISLLNRHRAVSCDREGEAYRVVLQTLFGETEHLVTIPFQKEAMDYRRRCYISTDLPRGVEERKFPPQVPCDLYDKVIKEIRGYHIPDGTKPEKATSLPFLATLVPPHHKRTVIAELMTAVAALDPSLDPNS